MTVPSNQTFDKSTHLSVLDVAVDATNHVLRIKNKQSKTDPFRRGVYLYVGRTGSNLCAVSAMLDYLNIRGMLPGPLFKFEDGRAQLWRQYGMAYVRQELSRTSTVVKFFVLVRLQQQRQKVLRTH